MARRYDSWGFSHAPSAAEIERTANKALAKAGKKGLKYHPVIIQGTKIARSWWGKSWCENLERYADYANRLPRGRSYVRHKAVIDLQIGRGIAHGMVQGSSLYKVEIQFDPLNQKTEKELSGICAEQIQNVEELVSGKFPESLKDRLFAKGGLFPSPKEIHFRCSCPDWAVMCKHVAAVMYGIGARLDEEPLGFFDLRGIQTDDFVAKAVKNKVEGMLQNAARQSNRVIAEDQLQNLFGLELGEPMGASGEMDQGIQPAKKTPSTGVKAGNNAADTETKKRRGRLPQRARSSESAFDARTLIQNSAYSEKVKGNLLRLQEALTGSVFGYRQVAEVLDSTAPTAAAYIKKLHEELRVIVPAEEQGKGKYRFKE